VDGRGDTTSTATTTAAQAIEQAEDAWLAALTEGEEAMTALMSLSPFPVQETVTRVWEETAEGWRLAHMHQAKRMPPV
jgi:ketosteroid isomerase-like protein